jgi:hypothetical protein
MKWFRYFALKIYFSLLLYAPSYLTPKQLYNYECLESIKFYRQLPKMPLHTAKRGFHVSLPTCMHVRRL